MSSSQDITVHAKPILEAWFYSDESASAESDPQPKVNNVRAPMPGLIIDLKVRNGDTVKAGDALLILEAMKMENIIKAPGDATVKSVKVSKGDGVEKNQVLIEF